MHQWRGRRALSNYMEELKWDTGVKENLSPVKYDVNIFRKLSEKRIHLLVYYAKSIENIFSNADIVALFLQDLRPSDIPFQHTFDMTSETRDFYCAQMFSARHIYIFPVEVDNMMESGMIKSWFPAWSFPIFVTTKKKTIPISCSDYRVLNQKMKACRFPLPESEKY